MSDFPKKQAGDYAYYATKAGASMIPLIGGAVTTVMETVFSAPIEKRKEKWLQALAHKVDLLTEKHENISAESLATNEHFVSVCIHASNIALRTHQEEKITRLLAAVENSVSGKGVESSKHFIFLRIIDEMTDFHFQMLMFLLNFNEIKSEHGITDPFIDGRRVWEKVHKGMDRFDPMLDLVIADLNRYGLVSINELGEISLDSVITKFGREFCEFVESKS